MPLVLTLHKARSPADRQRESRTLDRGSLAIGRGPSNDWVLQDPEQHLSKVHCTVAFEGGRYVVTDLSSNGVFLNGSPKRMPRDSKAALVDGDEFLLGDYLIRVSEVDALSSRSVTESAAAPPRGAPSALSDDDPFGLDDLMASPPPPPPPLEELEPPRSAPAQRGFDPFTPDAHGRDDPFGDPAGDPMFGAKPPAHRPFGESEAPQPPRMRDRLAEPVRTAAETARTTGRDAFGDNDDLFQGKAPETNWSGPSQPDNVDAAAHALIAPKILPAPNMDDWDDLLGDTPPGQAPSLSPSSAATAPVLLAQPAPPPVASIPPPSVAEPPTGQQVAEAQRLLAAFLEGAGVPKLDVPGDDLESYFRMVGELFGTMVESVRDVLMSRAAVKGEFGVERTMLRSRDNNALKFSVTPADAVAALLQPGRPGYMPPARATREAFDDIRSHQIAVMAGVQAALFHLLKTFDPAALEQRLQKGSTLGNLIPGARQAKLWDAFCATYKEIARDADADFQEVFGREFARAYNEQMGGGHA